jgi:ADP-heptose:LPS heptosyltransferase
MAAGGEPSGVLVIHPGALGDVLQAVPALRALRLRFPAATLTVAAQPRLGRLLRGLGLVHVAGSFDAFGFDALFASDESPTRLAARLAGVDHVVSWFGARAERFTERLRRLVPDALVAPPVPPPDSPSTVWEHLLASLAPWGLGGQAPTGPLPVPEAWRATAREDLTRIGIGRRPLLVVHPGAGGAGKRWAAAGFARVIQEVAAQPGCQVLLHQGPADEAAVMALARALDRTVPRLVEPDLELLAGVLGQAAAYLGGDSGVTHLAAALGTPTVAVFPPSTHRQWRPWSPTAEALLVPERDHDGAPVTRALAARLAVSARGPASYA